jgi:hypothetical protein
MCGAANYRPALSRMAIMRKILLVVGLLCCLSFIPSIVNADDPGVVVDVTVIGDNPDAYLTLIGQNPDVWIDGVPLGGIISNAVNGAVQSVTPNSTWSSASTGTLPPLANVQPQLQMIAPDKYVYWTPGWLGYFGVSSNLNQYVYKGAGCGVWGVSDGYPDLWGRRQIAGLAPEFYLQKEKLNSTMNAVVKIIQENEKTNSDYQGLSGQMKSYMDQMADTNLELSVAQAENANLHKQLDRSIENINMILVWFAVAIGLLIGAVILLVIMRVKRW